MSFLVSVARRFWASLDSPPQRPPFDAFDASNRPASPTAASWILHSR